MAVKLAYVASAVGGIFASIGFIFSARNLLVSRHQQELVSALNPLPKDGSVAKSIYTATLSLAQALEAQALAQTWLWGLAFVLFGVVSIAIHRSNEAFKRTGFARP